MSIALQYCPVLVTDMDAAVEFYTEALGLDVRADVPSNGYRWVSLGTDEQPELNILLTEPGADGNVDTRNAFEALVSRGAMPSLVFVVDHLDEAFDRAQDAGASIVQEPSEQDWGPRDFVLKDPAGNRVRVAEPGHES